MRDLWIRSAPSSSSEEGLSLPTNNLNDTQKSPRNGHERESLCGSFHLPSRHRLIALVVRITILWLVIVVLQKAPSPAQPLHWLRNTEDKQVAAVRLGLNGWTSSSSERAGSIRRQVHLVVPIAKDSIGRNPCMTLASALVNGYEPHIINWNGLRPVAPKFVGLYQYLEGMQDMIHPEDLLMLVDGHDTIFQLPQDHVIKQYFAINKNRKFGEDFIVTGADKACHPNYWNEKHVCDAAPMPPLPEKLYGVENGVWRDPATRPRWANIGVIVGQFNTLKALLDGWREKDYDWAKWINEQAQFNRALAKNETTVDYHGQIVWNGGADLDSFKAVAVTEPVSGIESHIPYGPLLPKLGMSAATGQIPVILHMNMGYGEVKKDAWTEDQAVDKVLEQLWWSSGREEAFKKIALRELHARRIFIGANDRIGQDYDELCGAYPLYNEPK